MTSRTGNKEKGFTLIEVMVAAAVLSLGAVLIYESFFISLDAFGYYADYLRVAQWMDEKIWEAQDSLTRAGSLSGIDKRGEFLSQNKNFTWELSDTSVGDAPYLYRIDLSLSWQEGRRKTVLLRNAYATYKTR